MAFPNHVKLVEVSPRDGLQNESKIIPTNTKIEFINLLSESGLPVIEAASFVSAKWIPQLADSRSVFQSIKKKDKVDYPVLIPNLTGLQNALLAGVKSIAVFTTPSESFSKHNTNCSVEESMQRIGDVIHHAKKEKIRIRGYLSCVLGCPYEGEILPEKVANLAKQLFELGCDEISLGDTIGVGTPFKTAALIKKVSALIPIDKLAVHFHDTYGQALANIYVALELGVSIIDSSVSGLGGCPYAKGASGNVASESVIYLLNGMGIETGIDIKKLAEAGQFILTALEKTSSINKLFI